ncbi:MAG: hypothetical protein RL624_1558 [Bacteroidota bacterium]|jgi:hypothetical protein
MLLNYSFYNYATAAWQLLNLALLIYLFVLVVRFLRKRS